MTREELIERLALLVEENKLSESEALNIISLYDQGAFDESILPMTREEERNILFTLLTISNTLYLNAAEEVRRQRSHQGTRFALVDLMHDSAIGRGAPLYKANPDVARWHGQMMQLVRDHALSMAGAGLDRKLESFERSLLLDEVATQYAYLERFADEIAFRQLVGRPLSQKQIEDRSKQYAGFGIGIFYTFAEQVYKIPGYVVDYIDVDDGGTCVPCHQSGKEGPYLPGGGPMPGVVCVARGKCRCWRKVVFDPKRYRRLINEQVAVS